jgi:D-glycero-D-manno-heptose 1,7-bisphosphate phosphatase
MEQGRRAVFFDRDGTLSVQEVRNGRPHPPSTVEAFRLFPEAEECCRSLKALGFLLGVVTNQPDVGRGTQSRETVEAMHRMMLGLLPLDFVEVSYDADDAGSGGRRKPAPGMLLDAARTHGVDLAASWMVGDRWRDVDCGAQAGCRTIFIDYGYDEPLRARPDFTVHSLREAVRIILERS